MSDLRFQLFGVPAAVVDGRALALPFERRTQLAALLALRRQWLPRTEVAALLWPELSEKQAFANLRKTLFRLPALPWGEAIAVESAALRFDVATDVAEFEAALAEGRLADALAACPGELLAGFDDGQSEGWTRWLGFERERLRAAWRQAALALLPAMIGAAGGGDAGEGAAADGSAALALTARLLDSDPLDEAALAQRLRALVASGQAGQARAAWREFVDRLAADLGLEPGAALRALHDELGMAAPRLPSPMPTPALSAPAPADDGFVGRFSELARITELLGRDECRLLCVVGPGGAGKTRLARRAMQRLAGAGASGSGAAAWTEAPLFIALDDVETAAQFGLRLAQAAGVATGARSGQALDRAIAAWRETRQLLVLDNFEQLVDSVDAVAAADAQRGQTATLSRLLRECPGLKLLVTSRVRLQLPEEWSLPLEGLPCPDPEDGDRVEAFDAVRLFVAAAQRVEPGFSASPEAASIVDICRQVDGLPLALELAAAWVRMLSCADIARELREGTELLRSADARHPQRQASLEAVFEHSWRRLSTAEREALARLSVFHGGFSVETARAVAGASLPVLGALADKSLLTRERSGQGDRAERMRLHPLVQQLAALRLQALDPDGKTLDRHAGHFHAALKQLESAAGRGRREALLSIDEEFENGRRAWAHSIARGDAAALLRVLPAWRHYFEHRARFDEGLALWRQGADSVLAAHDERLRARLLAQAALMEMRLARYADARSTAAEALVAARPTDDADACYQALSVEAGCAHYAGRSAEARELYLRALDLARLRAQPSDIASTLDNLALCEKRLGHYDEALGLTLEALAEHRRHGDDARLAVCLNNLGTLYTFLDEDAAAREHLVEAQALSERHGLVSTRAFALANLSDLAFRAGRLAEARAQASLGLEVAASAGLRSLVAWLKVHLSRVATREGALDAARTLLAEAAGLTLEVGAHSVKPGVVMAFAELLDAQRQPRVARRVLAFAAGEPTLSAPDRDELLAAWTRRQRPSEAPDPPWPGWSLAELVQRIVAEAPQGHAALIDELG